jgi:hypothetical protein
MLMLHYIGALIEIATYPAGAESKHGDEAADMGLYMTSCDFSMKHSRSFARVEFSKEISKPAVCQKLPTIIA